MTEGNYRYRTGRLVLLATLWLTLFILSVKVSAGWATRSLSLLAESLHTLITCFSAILSLLALTRADRPIRHEVYGHGKRETALTLLLAAFLGFFCLYLLGMAGQQLAAAWREGTLSFPVHVSLPLLQMLGVIILASIGLALVGIFQARAIRHPTLHFNARELLKDAGYTLLVLGGLLGVWWGLLWLDLVLAIILVILAVTSFWHVVNWQLPLLVEQTAIAPEVLTQIACQVSGVTHCYKIQSRGIVGRLVYIQMHLILHPEFNSVASIIAERIEGAIRERYGSVQMTFYLDEDTPESQISRNSKLASEFNGNQGHQER